MAGIGPPAFEPNGPDVNSNPGMPPSFLRKYLLRFGGFARNYGCVEGLMAALEGLNSFDRRRSSFPKIQNSIAVFRGLFPKAFADAQVKYEHSDQ